MSAEFDSESKKLITELNALYKQLKEKIVKIGSGREIAMAIIELEQSEISLEIGVMWANKAIQMKYRKNKQ